MGCMFHSAHAFNGDLSRWDTSNVTHMYGMFDGCPIESTWQPTVVRSTTREEMTSKVKREKGMFQ
jgi:surface protein